MRKLIVLCMLFIMICSCGSNGAAQEPRSSDVSSTKADGPVRFYHLEFVVQELGTDSKPINSRTYTVDVNTDRASRNVLIRTGSRVPVPTAGSSLTFQYVDLGINIDVVKAHEVDGKLALDVTADVSSLAAGGSVSQAGAPPVIRNNRWQSPVLVPLNKATVVFTSDSLDTKGNMQVQVTAKPIQ